MLQSGFHLIYVCLHGRYECACWPLWLGGNCEVYDAQAATIHGSQLSLVIVYAVMCAMFGLSCTIFAVLRKNDLDQGKQLHSKMF